MRLCDKFVNRIKLSLLGATSPRGSQYGSSVFHGPLQYLIDLTLYITML